VAELGLDRLDSGALADQQRRARMAQVVQPQPFGKARREHGRFEVPPSPLRPAHRPAQRRRKHQVVGAVGLGDEAGGQLVGNRAGQPHSAGFVVLHPAPMQAPVDLGGRLDHADGTAQ
jgi:hypothetical protein